MHRGLHACDEDSVAMDGLIPVQHGLSRLLACPACLDSFCSTHAIIHGTLLCICNGLYTRIGTYTLDSTVSLNGKAIYINVEKGRFIAWSGRCQCHLVPA